VFYFYIEDSADAWGSKRIDLPSSVMDIFAARFCACAFEDGAEAYKKAIDKRRRQPRFWLEERQPMEKRVDKAEADAEKCREWERKQAEKTDG
jgi:hypothetical protein